MDICLLCGNEGLLTADGVCSWRSGCDHRLMQVEAAAARFDADYRHHFVTLECGHTAAEHEPVPFVPSPFFAEFIERMGAAIWDDPWDEPG